MSLNVVPFPEHLAVIDIPASLRALADAIEDGDHGDCHTLLWVIDAGDGEINLGLMGRAAEPGITAHFLAAIAMRKIEGGIGQ